MAVETCFGNWEVRVTIGVKIITLVVAGSIDPYTIRITGSTNNVDGIYGDSSVVIVEGEEWNITIPDIQYDPIGLPEKFVYYDANKGLIKAFVIDLGGGPEDDVIVTCTYIEEEFNPKKVTLFNLSIPDDRNFIIDWQPPNN
jgi:hypothetical protein